MKKYIVALDQGTTSSRAIIFDKEQNIIGVAKRNLIKFILEKDGLSMIQWKYGQLNIVYFKKLWLNVI